MQNKHHAGPWTWKRLKTQQHLQDANGNCFAQVSMPIPGANKMDAESTKIYASAAALIKAAPDLLAALYNMLEDGDKTDREQALAAIQKATRI